MTDDSTPGKPSALPRPRFAVWFPATVFGALAIALLLEHSRPSPSDLPRFAPPTNVDLGEIDIPRGLLVLTGRLRTAQGVAAPGVLVEVLRDDEPRWDYSDDRGDFRIDGLEAGPVEVALLLPGHPPVLQTLELPAVPVDWSLPEAWELPEDLPRIRRRALYGTVSSPLGAPVGGCELVLVPEPGAEGVPLTGRIPRRVPIGDSGKFNIVDLVVGRYRVFVLPEWAIGGSWPRLAEVVLEPRTEVRDLDIVLESGEIRGVLLDRKGSPVQRSLVTVASASDTNRVWPAVLSDADGSFAVGDLPPGEYDVSVGAGSAHRTRRVTVRARRPAAAEFGPIEVGE